MKFAQANLLTLILVMLSTTINAKPKHRSVHVRSALHEQVCKPCNGLVPPLTYAEEEIFLDEVPGWSVNRHKQHKLVRSYAFHDFEQARQFVEKVADVAESQGHHPDITIIFNRVKLELFTHAINGLSTSDFILAARINQIQQKRNRTKERKRRPEPKYQNDSRISRQRAERLIRELPDWALETKPRLSLQRLFEFKDFEGSMGHFRKLAKLIKQQQYFPHVYIFYNKVRVNLMGYARPAEFKTYDFAFAHDVNKLT